MPVIPLYLKDSKGKGRGVFCNEDIPTRTLIHVSPVLVLKGEDSANSQRTVLKHYTYNWGKEQAVALGLGSMFNHCRSNNVGFVKVREKGVIEYYTLRDVSAGTELCIHYGPKLWFDDADGPNTCNRDVLAEEEDEFNLLDLQL